MHYKFTKMKKIITYGLIFIVTTTGLSQTSNKKIIWQELENTGKFKTPIIIGNNETDFYVARDLKNKHFIDQYDVKTLKKKKTKEILYRFMNKTTPFVDAFMVGEIPIVLTSFYNKKTKKNYLFYSKLNPKDLTLSNPKVLFYNKVKKGQAINLESYEFVEYSIVTTKDKKQSVVCFPDPIKEKNEIKGYYNKYYKASFFDANFDLINSIDFIIPFEKFEIKSIEYGNNGILYMLVDELIAKTTSKGKKSQLFIKNKHLLFIDSKTGEVNSDIIEIEEGYYIKEAKLKVLNNEGLVISGTIYKNNSKSIEGSFCITYDKSLSQVNNTLTFFEDDFINKTWKDENTTKNGKKGKKPTPNFYNYYINQIVELEDGSITMLAEQFYIKIVTTTSRNMNGDVTVTYTYYYIYDDIIAVNYDKNGNLNWKNLIKKRQYSINDDGIFSSFFVVKNNDEINLIYNQKNIAYQTTIFPDGEMKKSKIIEFEDKKMKLVPKLCKQTKQGIFLYAKSKQKSKIGLMK